MSVPVTLRDCPLIISTDVGGDPDAAITLALAAMTEPHLRLVITADEFPDGRRSAFARRLLDLLGRGEVLVATGTSPRYRERWAADGLVPAGAPVWPLDLYAAVSAVCGGAEPNPVRWLGIGPMTDLARVLDLDARAHDPIGLAQRLWIWQKGGALEPLQSDSAEYFRLDPAAARTVVDQVEHLALVLADHTIAPALAVDQDSPVYRLLAGSRKPWAQLIAHHLDQAFARFQSVCLLQDPVTFAAVRGDFVSFEHREVGLEANGRLCLGPGRTAWLSSAVDRLGLLEWVLTTLRDSESVRPPQWDCSLGTLQKLATELWRSGE